MLIEKKLLKIKILKRQLILLKTSSYLITNKKIKDILRTLAHIACVAKICDHSRIKTLTPKQMLQRLPVALPQVKAGKSFENLLNKICQIIYSLYQAK